jgi:parallel beta-helix repeat protein
VKKTAIASCMLLLLSVSMFQLSVAWANPIPTPPILQIYIRSDGTVDPSTTPIQRTGNTYTFTSDLTNSTIEVQRDNTVIDGAGFTLQGNKGGSNTGITLTDRSNVIIKNIVFRDYAYSISLIYSSKITIYDNNVTNSGILLYSSVDNQIIGNNITGNLCLVFQSDSSNNLIISNNFYKSGGAFHTLDGTNNIIYHNNFFNNSNSDLGFRIGKEGNFWDNGTQGNFWSDYQGVDANGDGVGDTPYTIQNRWQDRHPLMAPFNFSSVAVEMPEGTNPPAPTEPFPTTLVFVASVGIALAVTGLFVYFKKRKH